MDFQIIDTEHAYRRLLTAPNRDARATIFREIATPFTGLARFFGSEDVVATFAQWQMTVEMFAPERHREMVAKVDVLAAAGAWHRATEALERGKAAFRAYTDRIPLDTVVFGLYLADLPDVVGMGGYTGFGGIPLCANIK